MAILKQIIDEKGTESNYHRIAIYSISKLDKKAYVNLYAYKDGTYRAKEKESTEPLDLHNNNIGIEIPFVGNEVTEVELYQMIMATEFWQDAVSDEAVLAEPSEATET